MSTLEQRRTPDGKIMGGCDHTTFVLNHKNRNKIVIKAVTALRKMINNFDTIVCCGTSGILVAPEIASILDKNIVIVRKKYEKSYSPFLIEGVVPYRYIIVDDLICSGNTVRHIKRCLHDECKRAICVGVYCYLKEHCAYRENPKLCLRDMGIEYLNPYPVST
jgi:adenine/guanine phosphoribosyltransferase-like PRPP-binding protein